MISYILCYVMIISTNSLTHDSNMLRRVYTNLLQVNLRHTFQLIILGTMLLLK
jgi:hypothetical protein